MRPLRGTIRIDTVYLLAGLTIVVSGLYATFALMRADRPAPPSAPQSETEQGATASE